MNCGHLSVVHPVRGGFDETAVVDLYEYRSYRMRTGVFSLIVQGADGAGFHCFSVQCCAAVE